MQARAAGALLFVAVLLVAANLRMTITAVGPLLDEIGSDQGISPAMLGLLGALPLIAWGCISPFSHWLSARFGMTNVVSWSLVTFAVGTVWRSLPGAQANLWLGTAIIGIGIAVANVLMPAVIKRDFPARVALLMGLYTALLGGMAAVGAGVAVPISHLQLASGESAGWRVALVAMGAPIPIALVVWTIANRRRTRLIAATAASAAENRVPSQRSSSSAPPQSAGVGRRIWRDPVAWQVSLYMGSQSTIFYTLASWYAPYEISNGVSPAMAGAKLMTFQVLGLVGSLLLPLAGRKLRLRRWLPALLPTIGLIAWFGIPLAPQAMFAWIVIGGLIGGAQLTMSMTLMATRARTADHSTALSGMAQAVGYIVAAIGPLFFGVILGATGSWVAPFALIWIAAGTQLVIGLLVGRPRFILDR